jgi:hypothetical protein
MQFIWVMVGLHMQVLLLLSRQKLVATYVLE